MKEELPRAAGRSSAPPLRSQRAAWKKWTCIAAAAGALLIALRLLPVSELTVSLMQWAREAGMAGKLAFAALHVAVLLLCVWGTPVTVATGIAFGFFWGVVISWLGAGVGISLPFLATRYVARGSIERRVARYDRFRAVDAAVRENGWKVVALLRLNPVIPFGPSNYLFGLTGISFRAYFFASMTAMLPGTILFVYLGYAGRLAVSGQQSMGALQYGVLAGGLIFTAVIVLYLTRMARRALRDSSGERAKGTASGPEAPE